MKKIHCIVPGSRTKNNSVRLSGLLLLHQITFSWVFPDACSRYKKIRVFSRSVLHSHIHLHKHIICTKILEIIRELWQNRLNAWIPSIQSIFWHVYAHGQCASLKGNNRVRNPGVLNPPITHFLSSLSTKVISVVRNHQWLGWDDTPFFFSTKIWSYIWVKVEWNFTKTKKIKK